MISHGLEYLKTDKFMGVVVDNDDPCKAGRCRVKVFHLMNEMEDDDIPWACPLALSSFGSNGGGSISVPKNGTIVGVQFNCGDPYSPEYYGVANADIGTTEIVTGSYQDGNVAMSNSDVGHELSFTPNDKGAFWGFGDSIFQIRPDGKMNLGVFGGTSGLNLDNGQMTIHTDDKIGIGGETNKEVAVKSSDVKVQAETIQMSGSEDHEYAVNAKAIISLLKQLAAMIDAKEPATPASATSLVNAKESSLINSKVTYKKN